MSLIIREIDFSHNWNTRKRGGKETGKLDCRAFTTIRLESTKYKMGAVYRIRIIQKSGNKMLGYARIVAMHYFKLGTLDDFAYLDTGYSAVETRQIINRMYANVTDSTPMVCVLLKYLSDKEIEQMSKEGIMELKLS